MLVSMVICFITGLFLPMFVLGIRISAETRNERIIYYSILCVIMILMRLIWGGTGKGINVLLLVFILLFGIACYKAHDKVLSILGKIRNILSVYLDEIKKMSLTTTASPINGECNGSVLNMKKILKYTLQVEAIVVVCSIIGLYTGGQCLSITIGTIAYIVIMHGFLLKDEALLGAIDSIRRSTKVKLGLIDEDLPQCSELPDDDTAEGEEHASKKKQVKNRGDIEESDVAGYVKDKARKERTDKVIKSIMDKEEDEEDIIPVNRHANSKGMQEGEPRIMETVEREELPIRRKSISTTIHNNSPYNDEFLEDEEDDLGYKPKRVESQINNQKKRRLMQELSNEAEKSRQGSSQASSRQKTQSAPIERQQGLQRTTNLHPTESMQPKGSQANKNPYVDVNGNTVIPRRGRLFSDD